MYVTVIIFISSHFSHLLYRCSAQVQTVKHTENYIFQYCVISWAIMQLMEV